MDKYLTGVLFYSDVFNETGSFYEIYFLRED